MSERALRTTSAIFEALNFDVDKCGDWAPFIEAQRIVDAELASDPDDTSVLSVPMDDEDTGAKSVRQYLKALLTRLWEEGEGFSGKRPFGNSGWEYDLYTPLVAAGKIPGEINEDGLGDFPDASRKLANALIFDAIDEL